ncbi:hypothetical protein KAR10_02465, partial [bacterium]|nr:hypothetical protein [bacterium]
MPSGKALRNTSARASASAVRTVPGSASIAVRVSGATVPGSAGRVEGSVSGRCGVTASSGRGAGVTSAGGLLGSTGRAVGSASGRVGATASAGRGTADGSAPGSN